MRRCLIVSGVVFLGVLAVVSPALAAEKGGDVYAAFRKYDANGDGVIDLHEAIKAGLVKKPKALVKPKTPRGTVTKSPRATRKPAVRAPRAGAAGAELPPWPGRDQWNKWSPEQKRQYLQKRREAWRPSQSRRGRTAAAAKPEVRKPPVRKPPVRKPVVRKPPVRKPVVRKPPARKPVVRKPPVRRPDVARRRPPKPTDRAALEARFVASLRREQRQQYLQLVDPRRRGQVEGLVRDVSTALLYRGLSPEQRLLLQDVLTPEQKERVRKMQALVGRGVGRRAGRMVRRGRGLVQRWMQGRRERMRQHMQRGKAGAGPQQPGMRQRMQRGQAGRGPRRPGGVQRPGRGPAAGPGQGPLLAPERRQGLRRKLATMKPEQRAAFMKKLHEATPEVRATMLKALIGAKPPVAKPPVKQPTAPRRGRGRRRGGQ